MFTFRWRYFAKFGPGLVEGIYTDESGDELFQLGSIWGVLNCSHVFGDEESVGYALRALE